MCAATRHFIKKHAVTPVRLQARGSLKKSRRSAAADIFRPRLEAGGPKFNIIKYILPERSLNYES